MVPLSSRNLIYFICFYCFLSFKCRIIFQVLGRRSNGCMMLNSGCYSEKHEGPIFIDDLFIKSYYSLSYQNK